MPKVLKRNPRRSWFAALTLVYALFSQIEHTQFIHEWVVANDGVVMIGLIVAVALNYMRTNDHTTNDMRVQQELDEVKSSLNVQGRGIRFLMRKLGGKEGEEHVKLLFGDKE